MKHNTNEANIFKHNLNVQNDVESKLEGKLEHIYISGGKSSHLSYSYIVQRYPSSHDDEPSFQQ